MSLILDALKKAKELTNRKPAPPRSAALASFRFGRPSRSEKTKRIALFTLLALAIVSSLGYTENSLMNRLRKPAAVLIQPPQSALPPEPVVDLPPVQQAGNETPLPAAARKEPAKEETILRSPVGPPPASVTPIP